MRPVPPLPSATSSGTRTIAACGVCKKNVNSDWLAKPVALAILVTPALRWVHRCLLPVNEREIPKALVMTDPGPVSGKLRTIVVANLANRSGAMCNHVEIGNRRIGVPWKAKLSPGARITRADGASVNKILENLVIQEHGSLVSQS